MKINHRNIRIFFLKIMIFTIPFQFIPVLFPWLQLPTFFFFVYLILFVLKPDFRFLNKIIGRQYIILIGLYILIIVISFWNFDARFKENGYSILRQMPVYFTAFFFIGNEALFGNLTLKSILQNYVNGIIIITLLFSLEINVSVDHETGRRTVLGLNSNEVAVLVNLAILVIFGFVKKNKMTGIVKWIYLVSILPMIYLMISTGSRGGLVGLAIGFFAFYYFDASGILSKTKNIFKGLIVVSFISLIFLSDSLIFERFFYEQDNLTEGRTKIWEYVYYAIGEDLIRGIGVFEYSAAMTRYIGKTKATHNEYLTVLVYSGILGLFLFLKVLYSIFRSAMKANYTTNNPIFLSLFFVCAFTMFKGGGALLELYMWIFFGVIYGSSFISTKRMNGVETYRL